MANVGFKDIAKKVVSILAMLAILIVSAKALPTGNVVLLGIAAVVLHTIRNYKYTGWISATACPVLYALSAAIDTPEAGNLYVYYFFSYVVVIMICCIVEEHRILSNKSYTE
ncbi:MAG: hypothetical protein IJA45_02945 [Oscillospiraceae bacterium]|nr:hypothetical protein [Bacteroidaceae bacterium]MBQ3542062.1 hypothetical protein [Oscillospiraceae bacterium]